MGSSGRRRRVRPQLGTLNPLVILVGAAAGVILLIVAVAVLALPAIKKAQSDKKADRESAATIAAETKKLLDTGEVTPGRKFPDTPIGNMMRLTYEMMQSQQKLGNKYQDDLKKIGWEWVLTPDSLKTEKNLKECLRRIDIARMLTAENEKSTHDAITLVAKRMEPYSHESKDASNFYAGIKESQAPNGPSQKLLNDMYQGLRDNHNACADMCSFLLRRQGKYKVSDDGTVVFAATVSDADVNAYNSIVIKLSESLARIERLEFKRQQMANSGIENMQKAFSKP